MERNTSFSCLQVAIWVEQESHNLSFAQLKRPNAFVPQAGAVINSSYKIAVFPRDKTDIFSKEVRNSLTNMRLKYYVPIQAHGFRQVKEVAINLRKQDTAKHGGGGAVDKE